MMTRYRSLARCSLSVALLGLCVSCGKAGDSEGGGGATDPGAGTGSATPVAVLDATATPAASLDATAMVDVDAAAAAAGNDSKVEPIEPPAGDDDKLVNVLVLPSKWDKKRVLKEMKSYTQALGVKCKHCHVADDFPSDGNKKKASARKMISMARGLNASYKLKTKITCVTCHKGVAEPEPGK